MVVQAQRQPFQSLSTGCRRSCLHVKASASGIAVPQVPMHASAMEPPAKLPSPPKSASLVEARQCSFPQLCTMTYTHGSLQSFLEMCLMHLLQIALIPHFPSFPHQTSTEGPLGPFVSMSTMKQPVNLIPCHIAVSQSRLKLPYLSYPASDCLPAISLRV